MLRYGCIIVYNLYNQVDTYYILISYSEQASRACVLAVFTATFGVSYFNVKINNFFWA
jgi:hypothetical protein